MATTLTLYVIHNADMKKKFRVFTEVESSGLREDGSESHARHEYRITGTDVWIRDGAHLAYIDTDSIREIPIEGYDDSILTTEPSVSFGDGWKYDSFSDAIMAMLPNFGKITAYSVKLIMAIVKADDSKKRGNRPREIKKFLKQHLGAKAYWIFA